MGLLDALRKRGPNYLTGPNFQTVADNAPVGAVGAPGGLLAPPAAKAPGNPLRGLLGATSVVPGLGDATGLMADALMYYEDPQSRTAGNFAMSALGALPFIPSLATVFHGSPHKFDAFDLSKIGTGEGAQAYGHGLYFAEAPDVAQSYAQSVKANIGELIKRGESHGLPEDVASNLAAAMQSGHKFDSVLDGARAMLSDPLVNQSQAQAARRLLDNEMAAYNAWSEWSKPGALYTVDLPDEAIAKMLDWDKPLSEQAPEVRNAFKQLGIDESVFPQWTGQQAYEGEVRALTEFDGLPKGDARKRYSEQLRALGIPGIRYLDGGSRAAGKGTYNYVVFDDKLPKILKRE